MAYSGLRDLVLDLAEELSSLDQARRNVDTSAARKALDGFIDLIIEVATVISRCYSRSRLGEHINHAFCAMPLLNQRH